MIVFYGKEPCLSIEVCTTEGPNFGKSYGVHRDRLPDAGWSETRKTDLSYAKVVPETPELKQTLLEDLAYVYGSNTREFRNKLKEFNLNLC